MKKAFHYTLAFGITTIILVACGTKKKLATTDSSSEDSISAEMKNIDYSTAANYIQSHKPYSSLQSTAQASYKSGNEHYDLDLNIKSTYKTAAYFTIRAGALGITMEAAAGLAEQDSITIVNRIDRVYHVLDYMEAAALIKAPLNFEAIQNILAARPIIDNGNITHEAFEDSTTIISMEKAGYIQTLYYDKERKQLQRLTLKNIEQNFECSILYQDYRTTTNSYLFPYHQIISIQYNNQIINLELKYQSVEFNKTLKYDLKIPASYDKRKF